jgi:hypothetical protein
MTPTNKRVLDKKVLHELPTAAWNARRYTNALSGHAGVLSRKCL